MVLEEIPHAASGTPDHTCDLFERYKDRVYSIALRYTGDPAAAEDVAQDTFLKLLAGAASFRAEAAFESWLYRLVVNACFDRRRRDWRLMPVLENFFEALRAPGESALDNIVRSESGERVREAVANLPPKQRMIVVLRYTEGLTYDEIAAAVGCSTGTVASRLNRAHRMLARRLK